MSETIGEANFHHHHHAVQFYEEEQFLVERVAQFVATGRREGEGCVVIATAEHKAAFAEELRALEIDPDGILFLDARTTLDKFLHHGMPHAHRFRQVIGGVLQNASEAGGRVRAYGEMVDLLWRDGEPDAAIRLEELWNDLGRRSSFRLFCGYSSAHFGDPRSATVLHRICSAHSHVLSSPQDVLGAFLLKAHQIGR